MLISILAFISVFATAQEPTNKVTVIGLAGSKANGTAPVLTPGGYRYSAAEAKLEKKDLPPSVFQKTVRSAIAQLEGLLEGTCSGPMLVSLNVTGEGKWEIITTAIGAEIQVTVQNPKPRAGCGKS